MLSKEIFKAYDVRGIYPKEVSHETALAVGRALGRFFGTGKIVVARDGRIGSPELYRSVIRGLKNNRVSLLEIGVATTPMFYFLVAKLKASGGVIVTASHNPKEYNGFKVVGPKAEMISGKEVLRIMNKEL